MAFTRHVRSDHTDAIPRALTSDAENVISTVCVTFRSGVTFRSAVDAERSTSLRQTNWVLGGPRGASAKLGIKRTTLRSEDAEAGDLAAGMNKRRGILLLTDYAVMQRCRASNGRTRGPPSTRRCIKELIWIADQLVNCASVQHPKSPGGGVKDRDRVVIA